MSQDPLINHVLGGARLQQRVSKGLLAHVYRGHYERLGIPVAVKVLSPKAMAQGMNRERFIREGRALAQLSHPNIIKIYNVGHESGRFFIIMDWIQDGMNLRQLAQTRPLTPAQSLKVVQRLCEALDYIHQKNLIHRDLKPANVCLRRGGHPVLMDFSLIKDQESDVQLTAPGTIMGTVNFMPPEQAQPGGAFGNVSARSDVYSLGGTMYWLLTGKPPFKGRTPMETIIKLMRETPPPPSQFNPTLPKIVDDLTLMTLNKTPTERPASARDLANRIEQIFQQHRPALDAAQPPPPAAADGAAAPAKPAPKPQPAAPAANSQSPKGSGWGQGAAAAAVQNQVQPTAVATASGSGSGSGRHPGGGNPGSGSRVGPPGTGHHPAAAAVAEPLPPQQPPQGIAPPPGLASPLRAHDSIDDPDLEGLDAGAMFTPSMSTEAAAGGMLKLPKELQEPEEAVPEPSQLKFYLLVGLLLVTIVGGLTVTVLVVAFGLKFW